MPRAILIENPAGGGSRFTSPNRARRFVKSGCAVFISPGMIRFVAKVEIVQKSSEERIHKAFFGYDRMARQLTRMEMAHLPMVGDLNKATQRTTTPPGWSYRAGAGRFHAQ